MKHKAMESKHGEAGKIVPGFLLPISDRRAQLSGIHGRMDDGSRDGIMSNTRIDLLTERFVSSELTSYCIKVLSCECLSI